jgi:hypothetical protein
VSDTQRNSKNCISSHLAKCNMPWTYFPAQTYWRNPRNANKHATTSSRIAQYNVKMMFVWDLDSDHFREGQEGKLLRSSRSCLLRGMTNSKAGRGISNEMDHARVGLRASDVRYKSYTEFLSCSSEGGGPFTTRAFRLLGCA